MANKKILYVITKGSIGGATRYVRDLAVSFKNEYDVSVAAGNGGWLFEELKKENVRTFLISSLDRNISIVNDIKSFFDLLKIIKMERPDILHLNSSKIGALGALAGRIAGVPKIIFTSHGWAYNEKRSFISKIIFFKLHAITVLLSHVTIANSLNTYETAPLKKGVVKIYLGIKEPEFITEEEAKEKLLNLCPHLINQTKEEKVSVGTIAELHKNKGIDILIDSVPLINKNVSLTIIGGGDLEDYLKKKIKDLNIESRVCLTGAIPEASKYLKAFDIFVLPSRTESLGYVLLEAGMAGKPVVATRIGGIPEVVEDGVSGILVSKENKKELAEAINELAMDKQKREQFGTALKNSVSEKFSFEEMIDETKKLY